MIEEEGSVTSVSGGLAQVACVRRTACGACSAQGACGTSLLERHFGRKPLALTAANAIGARPGDRVILGVPEGALVQAALGAYLVPLLAMILAALGSVWLAGLLAPAWSEGQSFAGGMAGLGLGLWWSARFGARRAGDPRFRAVILRRVGLAIAPPHSGKGTSSPLG